ncbi:MAG: flippase-like domain-containing protein [Anaerolineae bacterium]|nr:flippase-like domain-containing protein [Anaerolineae bacterium]
MRASWKRAAQVIVLVLALGFLVILVHSQWQELRRYPWQLSPGWLALSYVPWGLSMALEIGMWRAILVRIARVASATTSPRPLSWARAAQIWFLSNIIRYIPGNIWQPLGMAQMCAEEGIPAEVTLTSVVVHQALSGLAVTLLGVGYFAWAGQGEALRTLAPLLLVLPLVTLALRARWLETALNLVLRRLGRPPLRIGLRSRTLVALTLGYVASWSLVGVGFAMLVRALTPVGPEALPHLVVSFALAWLVGYLSFLTPSGLGVREGAIVWLLGGILSLPVAALVSLSARLWFIVGEVAATLPAFAGWQRRRREVVDG